STPRVELGVQPRAVDVGATLTLPEAPDVRYRIADADGRLLEGSLAAQRTLVLNTDGEWLVELSDDEGVAARFPIYVGVEPPTESLLPATPAPLTTAEAATEHLASLLAQIREVYGAAEWSRDPILDAVAIRLEASDAAPLTRILSQWGLSGPSHTWSCEARSVEACVDAWVWDPGRREAMLSGTLTHIGITTAIEGDKVRVRIVLTGG